MENLEICGNVALNKKKIKPCGVEKLYLHCFHTIMTSDKLYSTDYLEYMKLYCNQWRGNKSTSITSVHIDHILQFCEKYYDIITQRNIDGN